LSYLRSSVFHLNSASSVEPWQKFFGFLFDPCYAAVPHFTLLLRAGSVRRMEREAVVPNRSADEFAEKTAAVVPAVLAGFLGWSLDAFDFFIVVMTLTAIGKEFHKSDPEMALAVTLTLAFRPVGALIFGLIADRYGRRLPLMIDLVFYSVIEVLSGLAHSFTTFLVLRALFGIGMGGEWGVGASLTMEKVPPRFRGVLSGLLQEGYAAGYLMAAIAYRFVFPHYGWRPLFFIGGLPALLSLFVRYGVKESQVWERTKAESWRQLGKGLLAHWKIFFYIVALMTMMNLSSHGTQDLYPTFLQRYRGLGVKERSNLAAISMIGAILGGIFFGQLSDKIGRRRSMVLAFALAILVVPMWALPARFALLAGGAFLLQFMVQGAWGVIPAHISELAPDSIRGSMPGFAYQCGNLFASGIVALETGLATNWNYAWVMAGTAATIFAGAIVVTALGKEKRGIRFG
jgi:SHS family lactate transporter-like MFS transporter